MRRVRSHYIYSVITMSEGLSIRPATIADHDALRHALIVLQAYERQLHATRLPPEQMADAYLDWMWIYPGRAVRIAARACVASRSSTRPANQPKCRGRRRSGRYETVWKACTDPIALTLGAFGASTSAVSRERFGYEAAAFNRLAGRARCPSRQT